MGMYSYFQDEDIGVKDWKGLKLFFKEWEKSKYNEKHYTTAKKMIKKDNKGKEYLTFESWNEGGAFSAFNIG